MVGSYLDDLMEFIGPSSSLANEALPSRIRQLELAGCSFPLVIPTLSLFLQRPLSFSCFILYTSRNLIELPAFLVNIYAKIRTNSYFTNRHHVYFHPRNVGRRSYRSCNSNVYLSRRHPMGLQRLLRRNHSHEQYQWSPYTKRR